VRLISGLKTQTNAVLAFSFFVFFAAAYVFTCVSTYSYDGLCYALDAEYGPLTNLFHANHLLYGFLMRGLWRCASVFGYSGHAIYVMQVANLLSASAAVALLFYLLSKRAGRFAAALAAFAMGTSHALWINASDPGCYGLATFAATLLLGLFLKIGEWSAFCLGLSHGALVLCHQLLILPAAAFLFRLQRMSSRQRAARGGMAMYMLGLFLSAGTLYLVLGWHFHGPGVGRVFYWLTHPADAIWSPANIHFWSFTTHSFFDSWAGFCASVMAPPVGGMTVAIGIWIIGFIISALIKPILPMELWLWPLILFLFQMFYFPTAFTYRLLSWPPFFALLFANGDWTRHRRWFAPAIFLIILAVHNGHAAWTRHQIPNIDYARSQWVRSVVGPHDFFIFSGRDARSITNVSLAYFAHETPARSLYGYLFLQPTGDWKPLENQLRTVLAQGGHIYIEAALREPDVLASLAEERGLPPQTLQPFLKAWKPVRRFTGPDGYALDQSTLDFQAR